MRCATKRHPFPIDAERHVVRPLLATLVTPWLPVAIVQVDPGIRVEVCDIDGDSVLFTSNTHWYAALLDEFVEFTRPAD